MKYLSLLLLLAIIALQYALWLGEGSWGDERAKKAQIIEQQRINRALKAESEALSAEISNLQTGTEAMREKARSELTYIARGETLYRIAP